jgi:hypothetical protein
VKKGIVLLFTVMMLLASFAFVGGVSADEAAPHLCVYTDFSVFPGLLVTVDYYDINGVILYSVTLDNLDGSDILANDQDIAYLPVVSGTVSITIRISGFDDVFQFIVPVNEFGNGECFDDGRLNSRPDRDNAAPVAIYFQLDESGGGFDVYDIDQIAGTGTLALHVTSDDLSAAYDQALETGANVTVAQDNDILFTMLAPTDDEGVCQVNALDAEGKPYEYSWVCWS